MPDPIDPTSTTPVAITANGKGGGGGGLTTEQTIVLGNADGGYEFTGGFRDREAGITGANELGTDVEYTQALADNNRWLRFGFSNAAQLANDNPYWTEPAPADASGIGLFGGSYMPSGVDALFDFDFFASSYSDAVTSGSLQYTEASGSFDFSQCKAGDYLQCRFDFNVTPQVQNTTLEVALIWQTRTSLGVPTFTFPLTTQPIFFGQGTVGRTFLCRPIITAYFASNEDVNARALLAVRADNTILVAPLTTLPAILR